MRGGSWSRERRKAPGASGLGAAEGGPSQVGGVSGEVSGGSRAVREKRWPLGRRPRPEGRAGPGVWVAGRGLVEGQSER